MRQAFMVYVEAEHYGVGDRVFANRGSIRRKLRADAIRAAAARFLSLPSVQQVYEALVVACGQYARTLEDDRTDDGIFEHLAVIEQYGGLPSRSTVLRILRDDRYY